jgi:dTDP-4-dehydrorhamnose 3,5-epimerase
MKFKKQSIDGVILIIPELHKDERGEFRRSFCQKEMEQHGINIDVKQGNISENFKKHTLRGFHYQIEPTYESKILSCITGSLYNVILDLRKKSKTFLQSVVIEISDKKREGIHVPSGCANAFITMSNKTIVHYYMGDFFNPDTYKGIRYNDPLFHVKWPCEPEIISDRDLNFPDFQDS